MNTPQRQFSLFDTISIIVGIVIGAGIFQTPGIIAGSVTSPSMLLGVWLAGGLLALCGAFCYTELTTRRPRTGGDYVFLTEAYGSKVGLIYAWSEFWIIRPGSIGAMAYIFAIYLEKLVPLGDFYWKYVVYGAGATALLTAVNTIGVPWGKRTQNLLTVTKVVGLVAVIVVGVIYTAPATATSAPSVSQPSPEFSWGGLKFAMIMVMFTYGGWNDMAFVAAEVRDPRKNLFRALCLGTLAVTTIYLLVNFAFISALGMDGLRQQRPIAADVVSLAFSNWGGRGVSLLVCISCLGAMNGMLLTGARVYYALGKEHRLFAWLGEWHPRWNTPARSLLSQATVAIGLIIAFGPNKDGFEKMVIFTTPVFWFFFLMVGVSIFIFRSRDAKMGETNAPLVRESLTPVIFCLTCAFMMYASLTWAWSNRSYEAFWAIGIFLVGVVVALFSRYQPDADG